MNGLLLSFLVMLPMLGLALFWQKHPRGRSRGLAEAFGAILLAVLIGMAFSPLLGSEESDTNVTLPMALSSMVMALSLNRMVRHED